ncbi:MAG: hypothetical protein Ta2D_07310 [Rickettsiales bacterium]|nr:MAG: hypothetical protein Ta2D_07310 [Rickettsiales bacterium]
MVKNDYLNFTKLSDLQKYAKENGVLDSKTVNMFHAAYVPNLADDKFNEHYYLNKEYNGKSVLELAEQRENYLAGIDKLRQDGKISESKAKTLKLQLQKVTDRENKHLNESMKQYGTLTNAGISALSDPAAQTKIHNINLNILMLSEVLESKVGDSVFNEKLDPNSELVTNVFFQPSSQREFERRLQSHKEAESIEAVMNKKYVWSLLDSKQVVELYSDAEYRNKSIMSSPILTKFESDKLKELENQKKYDLRMAEQKIKKETFLPWKRNKLRAVEFGKIEETYKQKVDNMFVVIKSNRLKAYKEIDNLSKEQANALKNDIQKTEISQVIQNDLGEKNKDKVSLVVQDIGKKILASIQQNQVGLQN